MTRAKHDSMVDFKHMEEKENEDLVMNAVRILGKASSSEVYEYLTRNASNKQFQNGQTLKRGTKNIQLNKKTGPMSFRTVQRHLRKLNGKGLVDSDRNILYYLSEKVRIGTRYFGKQFGSWVINEMLDVPDYELRTVKDSLQYLINFFGTLIAFCCIEAARPTGGRVAAGKDHTSSLEAFNLASSWINAAISPSTLFHYFMFIFRYQVDDETVQKVKKVRLCSLKKGKTIYIDDKTGQEYDQFSYVNTSHCIHIDEEGREFHPKLYRDIPVKDDYLQLDRFVCMQNDYTPPYDTVDPRTYQQLVKAFSDLAPHINTKLERLRKYGLSKFIDPDNN